jgi:hypothetical protein
MKIKHKFVDENNSLLPNDDVEYLCIGTFNPDLDENDAQ